MRHYKNNDRNTEWFLFDSNADQAEFINPDLFQKRRSQFVGRCGLGDWKSTEGKVQEVWNEGIAIMEKFVEKLMEEEIPQLKDKRRQMKWNATEGDDIDMDRLMAGQDFWRKSEREDNKGPSEVTIYIDTTTPASEKSDNILWRGAAAIALAKILEEKGYRAEIWVVNGSCLWQGKSTKVYNGCCLKRTSDPLDISSLINTVSGWFYRTMSFTLFDSLAQFVGEGVEWGYGSCATPTDKDLNTINKDELRVYSSGCYSFNGALGIIRQELQNIAADD